jgi:hypothetical protein
VHEKLPTSIAVDHAELSLRDWGCPPLSNIGEAALSYGPSTGLVRQLVRVGPVGNGGPK